ncbi:MAG: hypothetical protein D6733_00100 [Methanobacteriota archaeon]|nr:MAG: hypothetical protein D6733_00100 [Euryarchaeota archaeon]
MKAKVLLILIILSVGCADVGRERPPLVVVLSFDYEGLFPGSDAYMWPVLDLLERHNATATFFVMGRRAELNPGMVREIHRRNHSMGLHTYYHNFPLFSEEDAAIIAGVYNKSVEYEWNRSFRTKYAFYEDMLMNQRAVMNATGNMSTPTMFRSPSLVVSWTRDPAYFEVLKEAGIEIDSSIYQDFNDPRPFYRIDGIIEVPVVASEKRLQDTRKAYELAEKTAEAGVPLVLYIHPQNMDEAMIQKMDAYLTALEARYNVTYLQVEDVPAHYS